MPYGPSGTGTDPSRRSRVVTAGTFMLSWVALMWFLTALDGASGPIVREYGIQPRDTDELLDIFPAAFLHFGWDHVLANTVPLVIFGFLAALRGMGRFLGVVLVIIVTSGLGVWLTAPAGTNTAGASGVVFGLFGYLLVRGFVERDALDITAGITVLLLYGSILWGVLPTSSGVSWQGHLFGLIGGVLAAFWLRRTPPRRRRRPAPYGAGPSPWS
ncbi:MULTISPECIES: rhomboid family intramembrane serine protease [unclassified Streptomyces]|uniref:rhomboid family intramembrane serine protease n=1 Tax=unclassified Streptomyces TaxID=2593676 RepID=UPI0022B6CF24|nr:MULTISPECIES: rhomboid family intramembrane serine protease [unclassified Streptomyces]MCZ7417397.1 rhomboid family intramembrane serine protease [Streptomyces sp. WMMC897]MCZ7432776.1 rhomboid family intramembrane serine protease [Streptomyces sp. WMMC1477]